MELLVEGQAPIRIGATGMDEILQNIRIIVLTTAYSVPLDRGFAHSNGFVDSPSPLETARLIAQLTEAIEEKEPRVRVESITLKATNVQSAMQGSLVPHIKFHIKEGVEL